MDYACHSIIKIYRMINYFIKYCGLNCTFDVTLKMFFFYPIWIISQLVLFIVLINMTAEVNFSFITKERNNILQLIEWLSIFLVTVCVITI